MINISVIPNLVNMTLYRKEERLAANGEDVLMIILAYAQDNLLYDTDRRIYREHNRVKYQMYPEEGKVNKFCRAYRSDAPLLLHKALADIMVDAALDMHAKHGWSTVIWDGLRTVEAARLLANSRPELVKSGLLAKPGKSAHNKAMAVDATQIDAKGQEVDMGGHFDHTNMETNSRVYAGDRITEQAKENRLERERAFQRAAFKHGRLLAPLRSEFWDDRFPENEADLWRVLESVARCCNIVVSYDEEEKMLNEKGKPISFVPRENWKYNDFCGAWKILFGNHHDALKIHLGIEPAPPAIDDVIYHGIYDTVYDRDLPPNFKQLDAHHAGALKIPFGKKLISTFRRTLGFA